MVAPAAFAFILSPNVFRGPGDISAEAFVFAPEADGTQPGVLAHSSGPPGSGEENGGGGEAHGRYRAGAECHGDIVGAGSSRSESERAEHKHDSAERRGNA